MIEWFFWGSCALVAYVYLGYPAAVAAAARLVPRARPGGPAAAPSVTLIFCVHNELPLLRDKIDNCVAIDYPRDRLEILAASDGSTDGSAALLEEHRRRGVLRTNIQEERTGKTSLLNRTVEMATGDILLFTDASTLLPADGVRRHARHYADPRVGCVGGELEFTNAARGGLGGGHGLYWRYESWIRASESALGMLAYVPGANYSMRRALWRDVPPDFADDCVSPLNVVAAGRRVLYDATAVAREVASETPGGLFARRVRMVTRDLEATLGFRALLHPFRHGAVALSLLSHKLLRWLVPVALLLILPLNVVLAARPLYGALLLAQASFYLLALAGLLRGGRPKSPLLSIPLYFCVSNAGALRGLLNVLRRRRIGIWQPVGIR